MGCEVKTYLEHLLDAIGLKGAILVNIGTEDEVGVGVFLSFFGNIISQLLKDGLRDVGVEIVYENSFRHYFI
jgi:hypothetical protein